jgi:hypothetical protein
MGTSAVPLVDDLAGAGFIVGYFDSGVTSGWPAGMFINTTLTGTGGNFTALEGDLIVTTRKGTLTGIECFMDFDTAGSVSGAARACQATIDFGNYAFPAGGVYSGACFNIKGEGSSSDPTLVQRISCLELKTGDGTFKTSCDFEKLPQSYAIYFNGFTGASGVNQILSTTRLAELPTNTVGIRVGVGSDGATGTAYYIPLVLATEWN